MELWGGLFAVLAALYLHGRLIRVADGDILLRSQCGETARPHRLGKTALLRRGDSGWILGHLLPCGTSLLCRQGGRLDAAPSEALARTRRAALPTRVLCGALMAFLFGILPGVLLGGLPIPWPALLTAGLTLWLGGVGAFFAAHRRLYPDAKGTRWKATAQMALSPIDALHAPDALMSPAVDGLHPLTVARAVCTEDVFRDLAACLLREASHPPTPEADRLSAFLRKCAMDPKALLAPLPRRDPSIAAYCPRCLQPFTKTEGDCPDCRGVALTRHT